MVCGNSKPPTDIEVHKPDQFTEVKVKSDKVGDIMADSWDYFPYSIFQLDGLAYAASYPIDIFNFVEILNVLEFNKVILETI